MKTKLTLPAAALRMPLAAVTLAAGQSEDGRIPVRITARSGEAIEHWYWGRVVHDLAGMRIHKNRLPIDYVHLEQEVLGYLERFDTSGGDLVAEGFLTPFKADDRASEVAAKARAGVPYEASIFFGGPMRIEQIHEGQSATVNGRAVKGPATIIRQWSLRGVAICPYGADPQTVTQLKHDDAEVTITVFGDEAMSEQNKTEAPDLKAELVRYREAFGQQGIDWWLEGKPFDQCQELHRRGLLAERDSLQKQLAEAQKAQAELTAQVTQLTQERDQLRLKLAEAEKARDSFEARLKALDRGEKQPVAFSAAEPEEKPAGGDAQQQLWLAGLGPRLAAYAAAIRLPGRNGKKD